VLGAAAVPSLVDSCGYFFPSRKLFFDHQPKTEEVEKELRAQIERAINSGLKIDYVDYHMGTAVSTAELRALVEKLAVEYQLGIPRYCGEIDVEGVYSTVPEDKLDSLLTIVHRLKPEPLYLLVFHIGKDTPEMQALKDLNPFGLEHISRHREAELKAVSSERFREFLKQNKINVKTYRELIKQVGSENLKLGAQSLKNYGL